MLPDILKPANILLYEDCCGIERIKLLDFGVALGEGANFSPRFTDKNQIVGTRVYMAPEQHQSLQVGPQADIYALGLVMFQMLTGRMALPGQRLADALAVKVPPWLAALVLWALKRAPAARPTALQLRQALLRAVQPGMLEAEEPAEAGTSLETQPVHREMR